MPLPAPISLRTSPGSSPPGPTVWPLLVYLFLGLTFGTSFSRAEVSKEYQVKAAFLYNFTKFVEWPADRFPTKTTPIVIGLVGPNPFGDELTKIAGIRKANGRSLVIKQVTTFADGSGVDVVFFGADADRSLVDALANGHRPGVLTVGESPGFSSAGGMINFVIEADKVRFEINQSASDQAGVRISAQLLKLAIAVHKKSEEGQP